MKTIWLTVLCSLAVLTSSQGGGADSQVTLNGNEITIQPCGISFQVPLEWLQREQSKQTKFYLTRKDLDSVKSPEDGWNKLFSPVLDALIPAKDAVLHVGREPWESIPVYLGSLHVRVYVTDVNTKTLWARLSSDGLRILEAQTPRFSPHPSLSFSPWQKYDFGNHTKTTMTRMTFEREYNYGDVSGKLQAALYAKDLKDKTVVFVFLPWLERYKPGERNEPLEDYLYILDSVGGKLKEKF